MNRRIQALKYIVTDFFAASLAWALFYLYRKLFIESAKFGYNPEIELDRQFYLGITIIPILWIIVYAFTGTYSDIYRKSRLRELGQTLYISVIGVLVIFFTLL